MIRIVEVRDFNIPGLQYYTTLKRPHEHYEKGIFIVEGNKVVERFVESQMPIVSLLLTVELLDYYKEELNKRSEDIDVYVASKSLIAKIVGFKYHQGIMAVGKVPPNVSLEDAVKNAASPRIFAALDRIESAENTGAIVRNCAACGVSALIAGETSANPYLRRSVRNSMGTIFRVPVITSDSLVDTLKELRDRYGYQIMAAHARKESIPIDKINFDKDVCIVFGNEGEGVSEDVLKVCDKAIVIPMSEGVDSFNVACASAIILHETTRFRKI